MAFPGIFAELLDDSAKPIPVGGGLLAITKPWPGMLRTIWGDDERYVKTYFSKWPGRPDLYFPGDGAKRDADGNFWILGRVDDVLNVAGHRIGTMEVESALVDHRVGGRGGGGGQGARAEGPGDRGLRDAARGKEADAGAQQGIARARGEQDRRDREAGRHHLQRGSAQRRVRARSCVACCATSPRAERWATRRRWPIRRSWRR